MSVDLSIVIVNWNVASLLKECLISIYETPEVHCDERGVWHLNEHALEVWVVDNGSTDGSQEMVRAAFPQVCLLEPETNLGFGRANNLVMEKSQADYLLFLNRAEASLEEAGYLIDFAGRLSYLRDEETRALLNMQDEAARTLRGLIARIRRDLSSPAP